MKPAPAKLPACRFTVKFAGKDITLKSVSLRSLARVFQAVSAIVSDTGKNDDSLAASLHLVSLRKGSAKYGVEAAQTAAIVRSRLRVFGSIISHEPQHEEAMDVVDPLRRLSQLAKRYKCLVELIGPGESGVLARIGPDTYRDFVKQAFVTGDTTVCARIERVGGRTKLHCAVRMPRQEAQVWCEVENESIAKTLGEYIFQDVMLYGHATWYKRSWRLRTMRIQSVSPPKKGSFVDAVRGAYNAGGSAWAHLEKPTGKLSEIRGE